MFSAEASERLRELARRAGWRDAEPAHVATAVAIGVVCVCWALWRWWPAQEEALPGGVELGEGSTLASAAASVEASPVIVHVAGRVRRPGVYSLPASARVCDAVEAAGGSLGSAALAAVNLARRLSDGEQILIPSKEEARRAGPTLGLPGGLASGGVAGTPQSAVDVNMADAAMLDTLPGVGPSTAAKIIAERESGGPFKSVDDLGRVSGIGPKRLEQLREYVVVR